MTPEESVQHLARFVTAHGQFAEEDAYDAMISAGVPLREADRTYKFTQAAWGRLLLDGLGIQFADDYYWLDANGGVVESGKVAEEPHFGAAQRLGPRYASQVGFKRLAVMSAEVHAVNDSLNAGSRPEDLATAPIVLFLEPPTDAGMDRARRLMTDLVARTRPRSVDASSARPTGHPPRPTPQRNGAAPKRSWLQRWFGRGAGR